MNYIETINTILKPKSKFNVTVLDLFAGCGGLALGFESVGFETMGFESDSDCCQSYEANLNSKCHEVKLDVETEFPNADIIIGGPPCQPFSVGGEQKGLKDSRDGFPIFIQAIKAIQPQIFLIENVRGLLYKNKWYFDEIRQSLRDLGYIIDYKLINAANYGIPQKRQRVFIIGHKGSYKFPLAQQKTITAGEVLGELAISSPPNAKFLTQSMDEYVARYEKASNCITPRDLHLDQPARTLTCRNLAGATGDMMRIKLADGRRRRLSVREAARLQTFPDWFKFKGSETSQFNQIGNAVPPLLAYQLAQTIADYLSLPVKLGIPYFGEKQIQQLTLPLEYDKL